MADNEATDQQKSALDFLKMEKEGMRRLGHAMGGIAALLVLGWFVIVEEPHLEDFFIAVLVFGVPAYGAGWVAIRVAEWVEAGFS